MGFLSFFKNIAIILQNKRQTLQKVTEMNSKGKRNGISKLGLLAVLIIVVCVSLFGPSDEKEPDSRGSQIEINENESSTQKKEQTEYRFRNNELLQSHFEKHGIDMGFSNSAEYEKAASAVINNPEALTKTEKEDGDFVYYLEETNEFVILSKDGCIRTYFYPDAGKAYYDKQ